MSGKRPLALVTGARRGIGAAIAIELGAGGFDVAFTDREAEGSESVLAALVNVGAKGQFFESDLSAVEGHDALVSQVTAWGGPLVALVNNAGIGSPSRGDLLDVTPQALDLVMGVNLRGTFFLTQAVARHMTSVASEHRRAIVTVSSVSAEMASIERGEYCLSKSSLAMLTKLFALRLAPDGIGVFEVRPGVICTPMTEGVSAKYEQRIRDGLVPMGRWGYPEDVARAVCSLASGQLTFSTGSVLTVDGALSIPRL
jgi:NAD(P)-dependent dehydrogenase (short-subunit alcohol dehydrogenase family)